MNLMPDHEFIPMIIPTILIPLTLISVGISVLATSIAAFFGIKLKNEGPRKLLELLLKPRIIISGLLLNLAIWGGVRAWVWWKNYPKLLVTIQMQMRSRERPSERVYPDQDPPVVQSLDSQKDASLGRLVGVDQLWKYTSGGGVFATPTVSGESLFFADRKGIVSELDLLSGKLLRTFYVGSPSGTKLTIWKNFLYVGEGEHDLHHARVYQFDLKKGALKGTYGTLGHIEGQSIMGSHQGKDLLFVVSGKDGLHAVDPITMKKQWSVIIGHSDAPVLQDEGRLYYGTGCERDDKSKFKSYAASLDFHTGAEIWKKELPASTWMAPVLLGQNICYVTGELYFPSERGHLLCFNKNTGDYAQSFNFEEPLASDPLVLDKDLIVSTLKGQICRLDMEAQEKRWCFKTDSTGYGYSAPVFDTKRNIILYASNDKGIFALNPDTGALILNWNPSEEEGLWKKTYASIQIVGDTWIVADFDSTLRALSPRFEGKIQEHALKETY